MSDFKVKYLGNYAGPSYGGPWTPETLDAYDSIASAKSSMLNRQTLEFDYCHTFASNSEGYYVWDVSSSVRFPATTNQDYIELYAVEGGPFGSFSIGDGPVMRIVVGPRGAAVVERY